MKAKETNLQKVIEPKKGTRYVSYEEFLALEKRVVVLEAELLR
jgi:hypothetical protein